MKSKLKENGESIYKNNKVMRKTKMISRINKDFRIKIRKSKQKGGEKLGQGGFGCVISPPVKCVTPFNKSPYRRNQNYISKIVKHIYHQTAFNELSIGQEILKLDPFGIYFSPIINGCFFVPEYHPDIKYQESSYSSKNAKSSSLTVSEKRKIKKERSLAHLANKCFIDKNEPHFNLIGKYGGKNLHYYLTRINSLPEANFIKNEVYYLFFHLVKATNILHSKRILHKDIKLSNITLNFTNTYKNRKDIRGFQYLGSQSVNMKKNPIINLIDFGLSIKLPKKTSQDEFYKLIKSGTHNYIPPEIYIMKTIIKLGKNIKLSKTSNFEKIVSKKVEDEMENYRYYLSRNGFSRNGFSLENLEKKSQLNVFSKELEKKIIYHLVNIYINNEYIEEFLTNNYLFSWDIYSLGLVFSKIIQKINLDDQHINKLITNMVSVDYLKRISSKEILKLNIFKDFS